MRNLLCPNKKNHWTLKWLYELWYKECTYLMLVPLAVLKGVTANDIDEMKTLISHEGKLAIRPG